MGTRGSIEITLRIEAPPQVACNRCGKVANCEVKSLQEISPAEPWRVCSYTYPRGWATVSVHGGGIYYLCPDHAGG